MVEEKGELRVEKSPTNVSSRASETYGPADSQIARTSQHVIHDAS